MHNKELTDKTRIDELMSIVASLRNPDAGCQWHLSQDFSSIAPYTIEEAYEVLEAIEQDDMPALRDELGDLLFQVIYHARLAEERQEFDFNDVVNTACEKLIRRHPQVFDTASTTIKKPPKTWEQHKRAEKKLLGQASVLSAVESKQPAINQAYKLQKQASSVGFDWDNLQAVIDKLDEEIIELKDEIRNDNHSRIEDELGDVLFSCINLARHLQVNPERSLRKTNQRFSRRFEYIEQQLQRSASSMEECSLAELDRLWDQAKSYYSQLEG